MRPVRYVITYGSVEVLAIILGHFKYNDVWIMDVVDLKTKTTNKTGLDTCKRRHSQAWKEIKSALICIIHVYD